MSIKTNSIKFNLKESESSIIIEEEEEEFIKNYGN
jgi:hypothetical protein